MPTVARTEKLDLRLTPKAKRVLQSAATATKRSVSEFVLESALARAEETLPDRRRFGLDAQQRRTRALPREQRPEQQYPGDQGQRAARHLLAVREVS